MSEQVMSNVVKVILLVIVLILVLGPATNLYASKIMPYFYSFSSLKPEVQNDIQNNFDSLSANIQKCIDIDDKECICKDVIPNWPYIFSEGNERLRVTYSAKTNDAELGLIFMNKLPAQSTKTFTNVQIGISAYIAGENNLTKNFLGDLATQKSAKTDIIFDKDEVYPVVAEKGQKISDILATSKLMITTPNLYKKNRYSMVFIVGQIAGTYGQKGGADEANAAINAIRECGK